ncbi:family 1 extracellular solute-binding protein [Halovivax asiaticus JCM 14624]|uniref:Family 1 extracellular solute-binding protein n=1 Tax=Halovivax asiaticus JCM 14624 TaxID=1227490 RepID=M0B8C5_9EURY|nr:ABC transporter substrate-binding protein [Halovivax asiaticus]ELZ07171.1 family 1 extracellular solute-binding protein [Halovivax asiaticus JCM 14624]
MDATRHRFDRRTVLAATGAGIVGLAGCQGGPGGGSDSDLTVTGVWTGGEEESFLDVVDYVQDELDIDIAYDPRDTEAILTGTLMDYEAGVATADIVVMPSPARVQSDAQSGHLEPVTSVWEGGNFAPDSQQVTVDGDQYGAPFKMDLKPGFWYRQSFFDDNDLEEPGDYDEFMSLLDEIQGIDGVDAPLASGNGTGWPLSDVTEAFILRQEDGAQLQRDLIAGEASMTDDRVVTALEEIQGLIADGYFSEVRDFGIQFEYLWENQIPLYFQGSFTTGFDAIQEPSDLGVFRLPGTESMVAAENWFTVPSYVDDADQATSAVEAFVSPDAQQIWAEQGGFIASSTDVPTDAYSLEVMQTLAQQAEEVDLVPDLDDTLGDPFQSEFWSQLTGLWADPDQDVSSMAESLAEVQQESAGGGGG